MILAENYRPFKVFIGNVVRHTGDHRRDRSLHTLFLAQNTEKEENSRDRERLDRFKQTVLGWTYLSIFPANTTFF